MREIPFAAVAEAEIAHYVLRGGEVVDGEQEHE